MKDDFSSIGGMPLPGDVPRPFKAINQERYGPGGEPQIFRKSASSHLLLPLLGNQQARQRFDIGLMEPLGGCEYRRDSATLHDQQLDEACQLLPNIFLGRHYRYSLSHCDNHSLVHLIK